MDNTDPNTLENRNKTIGQLTIIVGQLRKENIQLKTSLSKADDLKIFERWGQLDLLNKYFNHLRSYTESNVFTYFTYFIQRGERGDIKIGHSDNPSARLKTLQTANSDNLRILYYFPGNEEKEIQDKFEYLKKNGEWFIPDEDLLDFIILKMKLALLYS